MSDVGIACANSDIGDELRLADGIALKVREGRLELENTRASATISLDRETLPVLERLMTWTSPAEFVRWALDTDKGTDRFDQAVGVLGELLDIGALVTRREDLTGARVPSPGEGWTEAMQFLLATRTTKATGFASPVDFNAALAEKSYLTRQASAFREYVDASYLSLSAPMTQPRRDSPAFPDVLLRRRTARRYAAQPISESQLSTLLYFGWGMTRSVPNPLGDVFVRKTSPSGGSLHPVEAYPLVMNVEGVPSGLYHYSVRRHGMEHIWRGDGSEWIAHACGDQEWVAEAAVVVLCTAFLPRTAWKYDFSRVARAVMAEIGFSSQSALLTATWLGLGGFTTLALRDEIFEDLIGLDPTREPVFSVVGAGRLEPGLSDYSRPRNESTSGTEGT